MIELRKELEKLQLTECQINSIIELFNKKEEKLINNINFLRNQISDNCCHAILDVDDCLEKTEKY